MISVAVAAPVPESETDDWLRGAATEPVDSVEFEAASDPVPPLEEDVLFEGELP